MAKQVTYLHELLVRFDEFTGEVKASHVEMIRGTLADDGKSWVGRPETLMLNVDLGEVGAYRYPDGHVLVPLQQVVEALQASMLGTVQRLQIGNENLVKIRDELAEARDREKARADVAEQARERLTEAMARREQAAAEEQAAPGLKVLRQTVIGR